jgi:hypothetical protein
MAPDAGGLFGVGTVVSAMGSEAKSASAYPRPNSAPVDRASPIAATGSCNNTAGSGRTSSIATSPILVEEDVSVQTAARKIREPSSYALAPSALRKCGRAGF